MGGRWEGAGLAGAILAVMACCGVSLFIGLGGGALAAVTGAATRYWPLTLLGLAAMTWAGTRAVRLVRARNRAIRERDGSGD